MRLSLLAATIACLFSTAYANTEKVIFLAPAANALPDSKPGTDFLRIQSLSDGDRSLRTSLAVNFVDSKHPTGTDHWLLLRSLTPKQRYELRVCWAAIQPTAFKLSVYTLSDVFDSPQLIQNLAKTINRPDPKSPHAGKAEGNSRHGQAYESLLFLHIQAAADYFSSNKTLMLHPPDVDVDLILDPYAANIFPESLGATAAYLIVLAVLGVAASKLFWHLVQPTKDKIHVD